jgi:molybdopterin synthase catalytic subunit
MDQAIQVLLSAQPIDPASAIATVSRASVGGIDVFIGTVRDQTAGKAVVRLEFEAYESMALLEMQRISTACAEQWPVTAIAIHHRTGILTVGEVAVVIAVSAAHRAAAFDACRYAIDTLKTTVPIWKKEVFEDGAIWVAAHP